MSILSPPHNFPVPKKIPHTWGLDLSLTVGGAGDTGGILGSEVHRPDGTTQTRLYTCDDNGNVTGLHDEAGESLANCQYNTFGETLNSSGAEANFNSCRFSMRYADLETGFIYYGYRFYSPKIGKWLSRDPIGEAGGVNLSGFAANSAINYHDVLGQKWVKVWVRKPQLTPRPSDMNPFPKPPRPTTWGLPTEADPKPGWELKWKWIPQIGLPNPPAFMKDRTVIHDEDAFVLYDKDDPGAGWFENGFWPEADGEDSAKAAKRLCAKGNAIGLSNLSVLPKGKRSGLIIIDHGSQGVFSFGSTDLNLLRRKPEEKGYYIEKIKTMEAENNPRRYAGLIEQYRNQLRVINLIEEMAELVEEDGYILFASCNLAEGFDGKRWLERFAFYAKRDVFGFEGKPKISLGKLSVPGETLVFIQNPDKVTPRPATAGPPTKHSSPK